MLELTIFRHCVLANTRRRGGRSRPSLAMPDTAHARGSRSHLRHGIGGAATPAGIAQGFHQLGPVGSRLGQQQVDRRWSVERTMLRSLQRSQGVDKEIDMSLRSLDDAVADLPWSPYRLAA
jgi:hypothetical protein